MRNRMRGPDELTLRLMGLCNEWIDDEQLKRMHDSRKGCTRKEVQEYVRLWRLAEGVGEGSDGGWYLGEDGEWRECVWEVSRYE